MSSTATPTAIARFSRNRVPVEPQCAVLSLPGQYLWATIPCQACYPENPPPYAGRTQGPGITGLDLQPEGADATKGLAGLGEPISQRLHRVARQGQFERRLGQVTDRHISLISDGTTTGGGIRAFVAVRNGR